MPALYLQCNECNRMDEVTDSNSLPYKHHCSCHVVLTNVFFLNCAFFFVFYFIDECLKQISYFKKIFKSELSQNEHHVSSIHQSYLFVVAVFCF